MMDRNRNEAGIVSLGGERKGERYEKRERGRRKERGRKKRRQIERGE